MHQVSVEYVKGYGGKKRSEKPQLEETDRQSSNQESPLVKPGGGLITLACIALVYQQKYLFEPINHAVNAFQNQLFAFKKSKTLST